MKTPKLLLFDIDGTLLMTGGAGAEALNMAFENCFGIAGAWRGIVPDGKTDPMIIEEMAMGALGRHLSADEYTKICTLYLDFFTERLPRSERFRLLPGVPDLLRELETRGNLLLGLATGNFETAAWQKVGHGGIRSHFKFGGFGSDSRDRGELTCTAVRRGLQLLGRQADPDDIFVIGDTIFDVLAGKKAGARTVGLTTGRYTAEDFKPYAPDWILSDLSDANAFFELLES